MRRTLPLIAAGSAASLALAVPVAASPVPGSTAATVLPAATTPIEGGDGACAPEQGVTVAVQFEKNTVVRCAEGDPTSGEEALTGAGFELQHDKAGMVCSIAFQGNAYPEEGQDGWTCGDFEGQYWSYWTAEADAAEWTSSQVGAGEHDPAVGEAIGWRYADGTPQPNDGEVPATDGDASPSSDADASPTGAQTEGGGTEGDESSPSESAPSDEASPSDTASDTASDDAGESSDEEGGWPAWATWALVGALVLGVAAAAASMLRSRGRR